MPRNKTSKVDVPVKRWQKTAASGCRKRHPFHHRPTRAPGRFNLFLGFSRQESQGLSLHSRISPTFSTSLLPPLLSFFRGAYFGLHELCCQNGLPPDLPAVMARGIYWTVFPTGLRPLSSSSLVVLSLHPPSSSSVSKLRLLLSLHPGPGFKSCHCNPFLPLAVHIGLILCLARRR
jgi:hypothetical protein